MRVLARLRCRWRSPAGQSHVERHRGAEHAAAWLGGLHTSKMLDCSGNAGLCSQGVAQIMHGQHRSPESTPPPWRAALASSEGFRRVEDEELIQCVASGLPYQLRYHWDICWISSILHPASMASAMRAPVLLWFLSH